MTDDFYRQHQRSQGWNRPHEMFEIVHEALGFDSLPVIVKKDRQGTGGGYIEFAGRRHHPGDQADQVAEENEDTDGGDHGCVFWPFIAHDIFQLVFKHLINMV